MYLGISNFIMCDFLSIYFAFLVILVTVPIFIYSIGYIKEYKNQYSTKYLWGMMTLFVLSMIGVILSPDGISFTVFWELMSVFSFFLVIYEFNKKENIKSGNLYFIMTHISGLFVMTMFVIIAKFSGTMNFQMIMKQSNNFTYTQKSIILIFALLAFGAKAGIVPLHAWLPKAHPSAPSNISALMSGVMLKIALYGFIRVAFMFFNNVPVFYAILIMIIGTLTAIFSILNALFQNDIKKLLAYSSAENMGIIFATLGLSMLLDNYGFKSISVLALAAALFHILNHAVFKSLLFTNAGSVLYATSTKNMNELGGLHRKMKFASLCAFIGTAAICAVPPLNGFASEILIFKSFIEALTLIKQPGLIITIILCGIMLALTSGGVVWASVKSFGITFLGEPRTEKAVKVHKLPLTMNIGMGILSLYAIFIGILSPFVIGLIYKSISNTVKVSSSFVLDSLSYEITIVSVILILVAFVIYIFTKMFSKEEAPEVYETWGCGFDNPKPFMQYSSSGFAGPAVKFVGSIASYKKEVRVKETVFLKQKTEDIVETNIYSRIIKFIDFAASKIIKIHYGKIQIYISYIFISLIVSIILVFKFV
jgi:hydrogenase-4 component B